MTQEQKRNTLYIGVPIVGVLVLSYGVFGPHNQEQKPVKEKQQITQLDLAKCDAELLEGVATKEYTPYGAVASENFLLPAESSSDMKSYYSLQAQLNPGEDPFRITPGKIYRALDLNGDGKIKGLIPFDKDRRLNDVAEELTRRQNPFVTYSGRCDTKRIYKSGDKYVR